MASWVFTYGHKTQSRKSTGGTDSFLSSIGKAGGPRSISLGFPSAGISRLVVQRSRFSPACHAEGLYTVGKASPRLLLDQRLDNDSGVSERLDIEKLNWNVYWNAFGMTGIRDRLAAALLRLESQRQGLAC